MKLGIIGAMESEVRTLISSLDRHATEQIGALAFHTGRLCGKDAVIAQCGVGKVAAAMCAALMIDRFGADTVINTGVGGAVDTSLEIYDLVIATDMVQHDMDTSPIGDPIGFISPLGSVSIPICDTLAYRIAEIAESRGLSVKRGRIATGDQFIATTAQKQHIKALFDAAVCEMEGGAIAQTCATLGAECVVLRSVSDTADERSCESFPVFAARAADCMAQLVLAVAEHI